MCNDKGTPRFRLVKVDCTANGQEFTLLTDDVLNRAKRIIAVEAFRVGQVSTTPDNRPVVNDTVFFKSFLTLSTQDTDEVISKVPLFDLNRAGNNGLMFKTDIPPIVASKCKINVANTTGLVATESFLLAFHYE